MVTLAGFYHAAALLGTEKIEAATFAPLAAQWLGGVAAMLPAEAQDIDAGHYATEVSSLAVNAAAIGHLVEASTAHGISVEVPSTIRRSSTAGSPADDTDQALASLIEVIKQPQ